MPELPEVETVRRDLVKHLLGARFSKIEIINFKNVAPEATFLAKYLKGKSIVDVRRRGKLLIIDLDVPEKHLLFHLKMTGQLIYLADNFMTAGGHSLSDASLAASVGGELPNKFTRAHFIFDNGDSLFFNDLRKFGYIKLTDGPELEKICRENYGPEPLAKDFNVDYLKNIFTGRLAPVKAILLNQKLIAGLGNIYVDEALFSAGIDPGRLARSLRLEEIKSLHAAVVYIIKKAIKARGTTFRNFVDARGKKGNFIDYLQVYGRHQQACQRCGRPIQKKKIAGRGTHYCQYCQK